MKKLVLLVASLAIFCGGYSDGAWAGSYTSYHNCGTGAFVQVTQWDCDYCHSYVAARYQIWGSC